MLTLIQLQYFVDTVAAQSFTLAAAKNGVTQTAVSQQLAKLERTLGTPLLDRHTKPIGLTAAGQVVYDQARIILQQYQHLLATVTTVQTTARPVITVGYLSNLGSQLVTQEMQQLQQLAPTSTVTLSDHPFDTLAAQLQSGALDLAIGLKSAFPTGAKLTYHPLVSGTYRAIVSRQSPLASANTLPGSALADQPLIMQSRAVLGPAYDQLLANCQADGFVPHIGRLVDSPQTAVIEAALGHGVAFMMPEQALDLPAAAVKVIPLVATRHRYTIVLAKRAGRQAPRIEALWAQHQ
ncbi:LysR family transcriptional regulator [Lacticaseibacillus nasuensis]|uniref:LysR family transcriptional regulator n=1 Tax=Lacticaseibacillus nasuensis TaxID=944671 RepID=UPI002247E108|nr:LysR family transcriptional regulator [Lacticaseibacillus nasuensis]MCX2456123.1 LysR family transcriptional regulator [Lacticaseibacillus nasuensis]